MLGISYTLTMNKFYSGLLTVVISALLIFLATGFPDMGTLMWAAYLPVLLYSFYNNKLASAVVSFFSFVMGGFNQLIYFKAPIVIIPLIINILFGSIENAICFTIIILLSSWMVKSLRNWLAIFAFPVLWTSYEFLISTDPASGTFSSIAYTQVHFLPLIQLTALTGIFGITFLLCLIPSSIAVAIFLKKSSTNVFSSLFIPVILILFTLIFGYGQLHKTNTAPPIRVALMALPTSIDIMHSTNQKDVINLITHYTNKMTMIKNMNVDVVLLPEKTFRIISQDQTQIRSLLSQTAMKNHTLLIIGNTLIKGNEKFNLSDIYMKDGRFIHSYAKQHTLPASESDFTPGTSLALFNVNNQLAGTAICKDMDFFNPAQQYGLNGVGILFVPALDFMVDGWLHARIAIMQGVANGYAVVRAAQWGLLTVSDEHGQVIAMSPTSNTSPVILVTQVKPGMGKTIYAKYGNWFSWLNIVGVIILIITAIYKSFFINRRNS